MTKTYVFFPQWEHDETEHFEAYSSIDEAQYAIEVDLSKHFRATNRNTIDDYVVIQGTMLKLENVEVVRRVRILS